MSHFYSKTSTPILLKLFYKQFHALNEVFKKVLWNSIHKQKSYGKKSEILLLCFCPFKNVRMYVPQ